MTEHVQHRPEAFSGERVLAALVDLVSFVPESQPHVSDERDSDPKAPLLSEATLYPLLGKADARTVLVLLTNLAESCGFDEMTPGARSVTKWNGRPGFTSSSKAKPPRCRKRVERPSVSSSTRTAPTSALIGGKSAADASRAG